MGRDLRDSVEPSTEFTVWLEPQAPMLHELIKTNRVEIVDRTRKKLASRGVPCNRPEELDIGINLFLGQLAEALRLSASNAASILGAASKDDIAASAAAHGTELLRRGLSLGQIVHYYSDICQSVIELAAELAIPIGPGELHTFNACLDEAQAAAVSEYGHQRELTSRDAEIRRLGGLVHELRNLLTSATLAYDVLKNGHVGIEGSAGMILGRSLRSLRGLIDHSLSETCAFNGPRESGVHPSRVN